MTTHATQSDKGQYLSVGMSNYISKPIRKPDVAGSSSTYLNPAQASTAKLSACQQQQPLSPLGQSRSGAQVQVTASKASVEEKNIEEIPILDIRVIEQINSDKAFIKEVHQSFLSDAPTRLQGIKKAFSDGDASSLEQAAHAFKSLSSCIGAMTLFHLCKQIEVAGKTGHIHSAALLIQGLEADYQKVQLAISEYQQQL